MTLDEEADRRLGDDADMARLAALSPIDYDRVRQAEAERLGIRVATLDGEVERLRRANAPEEDGAQGRPFELRDPEPWPEPVNGAELLDSVLRAIRRHMHMSDEQAFATTLWTAHAHVYYVFSHTPRLIITAVHEDSGKTVLMWHLVGHMVPRPHRVEQMKPAPFFRIIEAHRPTELIDECDVFIREDSDLLSAINSGWEPLGVVPRCVGDDHEVRSFSTHAPVALAGVKLRKKLPNTTWSRSIVIELERATEDEIQEYYDERRHRAGLVELCRKLARWCVDNKEELRQSNPTLPAGARNRRADKWRRLFAIAEAAGGVWPERAKRAYLADACGKWKGLAFELLAALRGDEVDDEHRPLRGVTKAIGTDTVIQRLVAIPESIWGNYNRRARDIEDRQIQPRQLAALLDDFRVKPKSQRLDDGRNAKGYRLDELQKAFDRHIPPVDPLQCPSQRHNPMTARVSGGFHPSQSECVVTGKNPRKPSGGAGCDAVTGKNPPHTGRERVAVTEEAGWLETRIEGIRAYLESTDEPDIEAVLERCRRDRGTLDGYLSLARREAP